MKIKFVFGLFFISIFSFSQTSFEIIKKSEEKIRGIKSSYSELVLRIERPKWEKEMKMKGWSIGSDFFSSVVTYPPKEKGTVFLKRKNEVWNYIPSIERTIKLPPSMMMQNWMGTDFTNDDVVQRSSIVEDYSHKIINEEVLNNLSCWVIELTPKEDAAVVWGGLKMWIDKNDFMQIKTEFYDEYGDLNSVMNALLYKIFQNKKLPSVIEFIPLDKPGNKTIIERVIWEFDLNLNQKLLMPSNMKNLR